MGQFICLMFITRGAAFDKIRKRSTEAMVECMTLMQNKYGINVLKRRPDTALDGKTITTPEIAASFLVITIGLSHKGFGRSVVDLDSLCSQILGYPEQYSHQ